MARADAGSRDGRGEDPADGIGQPAPEVGATRHPGNLHPDTIAVRAGRPGRTPDAPLNTPVTLAATYVAGGDPEYGRYTNPTWTAFEDALGALEGGRCLSFGSGMAAVTCLLELVTIGELVVAPRHGYNGVTMQL
ncbi:MAG: PLP-dependent transferase, partial [Nocardioides sp.]